MTGYPTYAWDYDVDTCVWAGFGGDVTIFGKDIADYEVTLFETCKDLWEGSGCLDECPQAYQVCASGSGLEVCGDLDDGDACLDLGLVWCEPGEQCAGDQCQATCAASAYTQCHLGDIWSFDSCGGPEQVTSDCGCGCSGGQCATCCEQYDYTACSGGDVWWFDSCGSPHAISDVCASGCSGSTCQSCSPNYCQDHGYGSGTWCDSNSMVTCSTSGACKLASIVPCEATCSGGSCVACGGEGQACCSGSCAGGLTCSGGTCTCDQTASLGCSGGDVWWMDCEGTPDSTDQECHDCACSGSTCVYVKHATQSCLFDELVWRDCYGTYNDTAEVCECGCSGSQCEPCGPAEVIVDNDSNGSTDDSPGYTEGGCGFWWSASDHPGFSTAAYNGTMRYTFGEGTSGGGCFAVWSSLQALDGTYKVYAHIPDPDPFDPTPEGNWGAETWEPCPWAEYKVKHDGSPSGQTVDTSQQSTGWVQLGTFDFTDRVGEVRLSDKATTSCSVVFDAVRWTRQ